jgi:hypothetical protein
MSYKSESSPETWQIRGHLHKKPLETVENHRGENHQRDQRLWTTNTSDIWHVLAEANADERARYMVIDMLINIMKT